MLKLPLLGVCCLFVFGSGSISGWLHVLASGSYAIIWFASYVYILPYWSQWLNGLQCALAAACIASSFSATIAMAQLQAPHTSAFWFFVVLLPALHTGKRCVSPAELPFMKYALQCARVAVPLPVGGAT
jgi:hypothetical protein